MKSPLFSLLRKQNVAVQLYGLPGTYKTTFLVQIIRKKLEEGCKHLYLIDTSGNFPIVRLESIKHLLHHLIVFQPKTLEEEAFLLDDLSIQLFSQDAILLIDDIFRHTSFEDKDIFHLNSYILALIKALSRFLTFPVILTNQARSYEDVVRPFLQHLTLQYLDCHFFFEKQQDPFRILISFFKKERFIVQREYEVNSSGFLIDL